MRILSLGAGIQSTALLCLHEKGIVQADTAIFADTGNESDSTYRHLEYLKEKSGLKIITVQKGNIVSDLKYHCTDENSKNWNSIPPFWIRDKRGDGKLNQQCSEFYKRKAIKDWIRKEVGVKEKTEILIGISTDEIIRVKPPKEKYLRHVYPLIELRFNRKMCAELLRTSGWNIPEKSGCKICPFLGKRLKTLSVTEQDELSILDELLRPGIKSDKKNRQYFLSSRRIPIRQILETERKQPKLFDLDDEEENSCDSGICFN